ncbi:MAG: SMC-Scp complex subunit ScpB [Candidatus Omnitrophota bacterium]|nr:SMC-Scp complex subunit ScpB [Candidatus Omnitrophota bacterium]
MENEAHLKGVIEALLFISEKPLLLEQVKDVLEGVDTQIIRELLVNLKNEYEERKSGIRIVEVAGGFQMITSEDYASYIKKFYKSRHKERLSSPALETLAVIAYKQPVTRLEIESIRGVNVDGVINTLLEKGLVRIAGRKDVLGRPFVYGTTRQFLEYFGLKSLADLPKLEDFSSLQQNTAEENTPSESKDDVQKPKDATSGEVSDETNKPTPEG